MIIKFSNSNEKETIRSVSLKFCFKRSPSKKKKKETKKTMKIIQAVF